MSKAALMVMDLQNGIVNMIGNNPDYISRVQQVIATARKAGMQIIYVVVKFRQQYPEVSPRNKAFAALTSGAMKLNEGDAATELHDAFAMQPGDILVTKRRVGAFSGSDLDVVLRSLEIDHLVLTGLATSGVVLSTLRVAADMDYKLTVLSDCCMDRDEEVHRVLTEKVFPSQAEVLTAKQWSERC